MLESLEQESPLAEIIQKLGSAHLNAKKDVSNEYEPYLIYTSSAVNKTIYSRFKVMNMNLLMLHCHRN